MFDECIKLGKVQGISNFNIDEVLSMMIEILNYNKIVLYMPRGKIMPLETTFDHLNSFWAPLNHLLCPSLHLAIEKVCLSSILLPLRYQNVMDTNK